MPQAPAFSILFYRACTRRLLTTGHKPEKYYYARLIKCRSLRPNLIYKTATIMRTYEHMTSKPIQELHTGVGFTPRRYIFYQSGARGPAPI